MNTEIIFASESDEKRTIGERGSWKILIIDDEDSVHKITRLVLENIEFEGKKLELFSCYSLNEAMSFLSQTADIAVILLDVVMEDDDSGLTLVKYIRKDLKNNIVRIVLRTGQPGYAPEQQVIVEYDINDYKAKTELTADKLFTSVISSIRAYRDLQTIANSKIGLENIVSASKDIFELKSLKQFISGLLTQFTSIFADKTENKNEQISGLLIGVSEGHAYVASAEGFFDTRIIGLEIHKALERNELAIVESAFENKKNQFDKNLSAAYFVTRNGIENVIFLKKNMPFEPWEIYILEIFCSNISIAFENIYLKEELDTLVDKRTNQLKHANDALMDKNITYENELKIAKDVQNSLMPKKFPISDKYAIWGEYHPMYNLGGDYYDVFFIDENRLAAVVADVSGHGLAASLITAMAKMSFTSNLSSESPAETINTIHNNLYNSVGKSGIYITIFYAIIDFNKMEMEYSSGGHNDVFILKQDGRIETLESINTIVGIFPMEKYVSDLLKIDHGDKLILFTDGIIETKNPSGDFFGKTVFKDLIKKHGNLNAQMFVSKIIEEVEIFSENGVITDDRTILVIDIY